MSRTLHDLFDLSGRVALITGGSRGLGLSIAEALGEYGAQLVLTARKADELEAARAHLEAQGLQVMTVQHDLSAHDTVTPMVEGVLAACGKVDILVNNAGTTWGAPTAEHPLAAWRKVLDLNLTGLFLVTQAVGRLSMLPRRGGRVLNVASVAGLQGGDPQLMPTLAYSTSKGGVVNFTRALASEWAAYGVTVNSICPGYFPTKMTRGTLEHAEAHIIARTPLGRLGSGDDLKGVALLLSSDAGAYITGQNIAVDGGLSVV
jgi:NAD(P)-dependent dehydrogenase (short-subunit alcohol dehydrogenase family)